ncbi:type IV pilus assembly protein FimV, partial [Ralstonia solanacearum]|uniref:type IV pilus assembly protein FimV n=1 Tax=Ralstonia solanacearum TaxID=305 RepID=UPI0018C23EDD
MRVSQYRRRESSHRSPRWSAVAIAAASLLLIQPVAHAAGFGALHVRSSLGQPLQADIDLTGVTEEEAQNLVAKLASPDAYQRAGLTYNPIVSALRASLVRQSGGSYVVRVISAQPVAEPFVDILVDLTWASGRVSRAYTFLLDPAGSSNTPRNFAPTPVVQATTPGVADSAAAPQSQAAAPATQRAARPARQAARPQADAAAAADTASGGAYTVQRGDSLYDVASNAVQGQDAVSLDQMLLALYRNNPKAFIGGNINRLRTGSVLTVPSAADAQKVPSREARREVVAQTSGFAGYRSRLATAAEANAATDTDSARQQSGSVSARVQDQATPSASERDELRLSKAERAGKAGASAAARDEELVAKERALKEMESRVAQLEKNLSEMQRLIEVKNAELAKAANGKPAAGAAPSTAAPAVTAANAPAPAPSASAAPAQAPAATAPAAPSSEAAAAAPAAAAPAGASAPVSAASAPVAAGPAPPAPPPKG